MSAASLEAVRDEGLAALAQARRHVVHMPEKGSCEIVQRTPRRRQHEGTALEPCLTYSIGFRAPARRELAVGFLAFLESAGMLTPPLRELIIERALAVEEEPVPLEAFKVIVLMVLWTRQGNLDSLILEELLPDDEARRVH